MLVLRDMIMMGKRYYGEFLKSGEGISTNLLADRLKRLEKGGLVTREVDKQHGAKVRYELTEKGWDFGAVLVKLILWSGTHYETAIPADKQELLKDDPAKLEAWLHGLIRKQRSLSRK